MQVYSIPINSDQREITHHGTSEFPIAVYETDLEKNVLGYVPWHWHEEIQFCYVVSERVCFHINHQKVVLEKDQGIFISSNILHMATPADGKGGVYVCMDVDPALLRGFGGSVIARRYVNPVLENKNRPCLYLWGKDGWEREAVASMKTVYDLYRKKGEGYEMDITIALLSLWKELYLRIRETAGTDADSVMTGRDNERIKQILSYIHEHFSEKITLEQIAGQVNVSRNECCRFFKRYMGCSIFTYLMDYRILKSTELLLATDWPVSMVASSCGFHTASYYIEQFRRKRNATPGEYRSGRR